LEQEVRERTETGRRGRLSLSSMGALGKTLPDEKKLSKLYRKRLEE